MKFVGAEHPSTQEEMDVQLLRFYWGSSIIPGTDRHNVSTI
jgi:hypothetical protein